MSRPSEEETSCDEVSEKRAEELEWDNLEKVPSDATLDAVVVKGGVVNDVYSEGVMLVVDTLVVLLVNSVDVDFV